MNTDVLGIIEITEFLGFFETCYFAIMPSTSVTICILAPYAYSEVLNIVQVLADRMLLFVFQFAGVECVIMALTDEYAHLALYKTRLTIGLCVLLFLLGLPFVTQVYTLLLIYTLCH